MLIFNKKIIIQVLVSFISSLFLFCACNNKTRSKPTDIHPSVLFQSENTFKLCPNKGYGTITWDGKIFYKSPNMQKFEEWDGGEIFSELNNQTLKYEILLRGENNTVLTSYIGLDPTSVSYNAWWTDAQDLSISGDIRALLNYSDFSKVNVAESAFENMFLECTGLVDVSEFGLNINIISEKCFKKMFANCKNLLNGPKELPFTTLLPFCYQEMFLGCESLESAPKICATTLADSCCYAMFQDCTNLVIPPLFNTIESCSPSCYYKMFSGCTSLAAIPKNYLPATTLAERCYQYMFENCTELTNAPNLPATKMEEYCYYCMFSGCSNLKIPPVLPSENLASYCYAFMFMKCTNLEKIPALPANELDSNCYYFMFSNCPKIKVSKTQSLEYNNLFFLGKGQKETDYNFTLAGSVESMFYKTGGSFTDRPYGHYVGNNTDGYTYYPEIFDVYTSNEIVGI